MSLMLEHSAPPGSVAREPLYQPTPEQIAASQLTAFIHHCEQRGGIRFGSYRSFEKFCIDRSAEFWQLFLDWSGIAFDGIPSPARVGGTCESAVFFPEVRLNFA